MDASAIQAGVGARVPPPAPADHPLRDAILVIAFALALLAAFVGALLQHDLQRTPFEKRTTAPWPPVSAIFRAWPAFPRAFEAAFDDRFGGRNDLIFLHHALLAIGLHVSPVSKVLLGRDDWLYFRGEDTHAIERDFRGVFPYPPDQPRRIAEEIARRHAFLAARGIPYVVLIAPDKASIYPEHLPAWIRRAPSTRLDRLVAEIARHPEISVVDPRAALTERKSAAQVYFRTDSHWNYEGAIVAYDVLMPVLQRQVREMPHVPAERPTYDPEDVYSGDLADLLGLPEWYREPDWLPWGKILADPSRRCARPVRDAFEPVVEGCARAGLPRAVVYRDSMMDLMMPALSENFSRVVYVSGHVMRAADIARERPDVVIEQFVERSMHILLTERLP